jgi:hypothetical protein
MTSGELSAILTPVPRKVVSPMPLVLTLNEGEDFYIRDDRVVLEKIHSQTEFSLRRGRDNALIRIQEGRSVELFRGVFVTAGARGQLGLSRIAIEAPRSLPILRGDLYRQSSAR